MYLRSLRLNAPFTPRTSLYLSCSICMCTRVPHSFQLQTTHWDPPGMQQQQQPLPQLMSPGPFVPSRPQSPSDDSPNQQPSSGFYPNPMSPPVGYGMGMQQPCAPGAYPGQHQPPGYAGTPGYPSQPQMAQGYPGQPQMGQVYPMQPRMGHGYPGQPQQQLCPQPVYGGPLVGGYPGQQVPQEYGGGQQMGPTPTHVSGKL